MTQLRFLIVVLFASFASGTAAQSLNPGFIISIKEKAGVDPNEALALIEAELKLLLKEQPPDPQTIYSLLDFYRGLVARQNGSAGEAGILLDMAIFAQKNRAVLSVDPFPLLVKAADSFFAARRFRDAQQALENALNLAIEDGRSTKVRIELLEKLVKVAEARDNTKAKRRYGEALVQLKSDSQNPTAPETSNTATRGDGEGYKSVKIFYATDRKLEESDNPTEMFGGGRGQLQYGTAVVTIPENHKSGAVESPSVWKLEFSESSNKHVILKSVRPTRGEAYFSEMRNDLKGNLSKEAFIFIHGFNVSFEGAVKRTAQLAHDMKFSGLPITYSWPSRHSVLEYVADTAVVRLSGRRLAGFLEDVVRQSGATTIHLIAHSMGNRALTDALELIAAKGTLQSRENAAFDQIVFAAPDVDAGLFVEMVKTIRPLAKRLTLYASNNDWALKVSQKIHGNSKRAGQGGKGTIVNGTIDSIDMSDLGGDMLAHGYFARDTSALLDLASLFWQNADPDLRCGLEKQEANDDGKSKGYVWVYKPDICNTEVVLPLLAHIRQRSLRTQQQLKGLMDELKIDHDKYPNVESVVGRMLNN